MVLRLGGTLPVVVEDSVWEDTAEEIDDIVLGDAEVWCAPKIDFTDIQVALISSV